eukprot:CAMPEP_0197524304 /NCGR_PEP_ID=MMETSP1318-20131121/9016_1 /TAXON_ID=552666 /ORGANISM="Partenskyella glossopodia, Strain RCC365" /LENGTH=31 /DNA_ID= /DNA_START= /DNA_END= /DNA_ORIENTATION=
MTFHACDPEIRGSGVEYDLHVLWGSSYADDT